MNKDAIVIVGPTAIGKTALSIDLAKKWNGEIINVDSAQVYRGMDIGTAKIKQCEMEGIVHHLFDVCDVTDPFSVSDYQTLAREKIEEIKSRGKLPIFVGGTGLYVKATMYDWTFGETNATNEEQMHYEQMAKEQGVDALHALLVAKDPIAAKQIHPNNVRRVARALVLASSEQSKSAREATQQQALLYDVAFIGLDAPRDVLYERINLRVEQMIEAGLEEEVRLFFENGQMHTQALQAIGYKEWLPYFEGNCTKEAVIQAIQQNSRRYAKRQFTYFKNQLPITWFPSTTRNENFLLINKFLLGMEEI